MIKTQRERQIVSILGECEELTIHELSRRLGRVSSVTIRRDVARLAERGLIERTHGGAAALRGSGTRPQATSIMSTSSELEDVIGEVDAIVLPPVEGRGADTLRMMVRRRHIPFLAESSPQEGGVYLGPDNFGAGRELGRAAGRLLTGRVGEARILLVSLEQLPNTRARCDGFLKGFGETFGGESTFWRVEGRGSFRLSLRASLDALEAHPEINVLFGVNDHSILAAIEASDRLAIDDVHGFSVGGEGASLFDALAADGKLRACAALFPEIVGMRAIEVLAGALDGGGMPPEIRTPHAVLTPGNLGGWYRREGEGWSLREERALADEGLEPAPPHFRTEHRSIGFVPHYPAHDWYRNMERAMRVRARELGFELKVAAPQAGIAREIAALRGCIAKAAATRIAAGDTILVNAGEISMMLAEELASMADVTIVTNALDVMERLSGVPGLKVILTSGEHQPKHRCLVGPSLGALFETLRVDKAFLSVDGVSARFGLSSSDERLALAARRFVDAAREVIVLADHSLVGIDANHRIAPLRAVREIITDSGSLPADRLTFASAGTHVALADEEVDDITAPPAGRAA